MSAPFVLVENRTINLANVLYTERVTVDGVVDARPTKIAETHIHLAAGEPGAATKLVYSGPVGDQLYFFLTGKDVADPYDAVKMPAPGTPASAPKSPGK